MTRVLLDVADGVATVTLNDPKRRNAFDLDLCDEVLAAFDRIEADESVCAIVITGAGSAFCAGADLSHLGSQGTENGLMAIYQGFLRVARSPLPSIAAVNGPAVGAGMNLALACDVRLAATSAVFDSRFLDLGIHPGGGHTWMFRNIAGPQATFASNVFGQAIDGQEAVRIGLAWKCFDDDQLLAEAHAMAARASVAPRELIHKMTASIRTMGRITDHDEAVQIELGPQAWATEQPHFQNKLAALKKKISSSS